MDTQLTPFPMLSCPFLPIPVHLRTSKCHKRNGTCKLIVNCKKSTNILKTFQVDWSFDQCKSIPKQTKHWKTNCPNLAQWRYLLCRTQTTISRWFQWKNWWKIAWGYQYFHPLDGPHARKRFQPFPIFVIRTPKLLDKFLYLEMCPDLPRCPDSRAERAMPTWIGKKHTPRAPNAYPVSVTRMLHSVGLRPPSLRSILSVRQFLSKLEIQLLRFTT